MVGRPVICLGAGAIGSLVGACLHRSGTPTALVGRGSHLETIRRQGLTITGPGTDGPGSPAPVAGLRLPAFTSVAEAARGMGTPGVVILAVKAYDTAEAARELAAILPAPGLDSAPTVVICLENGVGSEEIVAGRLPGVPVVAGAITLSVERPEPGLLRLDTGHGGITLAPWPAATSLGRQPICEHLRQAGFRLRIYDRGDAVKWSKLLLNLWANATSAVYRTDPVTVAADPALFHLDWLAFREALAVMRAARIPAVDLPGYPVRLLAVLGRVLPETAFRRLLGPKVAGGRGGKRPSLVLDLEAGRRSSEVGFLNGAVVTAARRLGLPAPANQALTEALQRLVQQGLSHVSTNPDLQLTLGN